MTSRLRTAGILAGLVAITAAVFGDVRTFDFVSYDDPWYVTNNPNVTAGLSWHGLWWALTAGYLFYWHPLTWLSHMADVQLFGLWAGGHHLTNLFWHTAATLALFGFLRRATRSEWRSAFVAALFAVHPLHVESVAWIAERKDVLSTFFFMLTLWAYCAYVESRTPRRYCVALLCFAFGLMAKPMLVTLPVVLILIDLWPLRRPLSVALLREKLPFFGLALVVGVATVAVQSQVGAVGTLSQLPLDYRIYNALLSFVKYAGLMMWPSGLAVFYPYPPALPPLWHVVGAALLIGLVTLAALRGSRRRPYMFVGWMWYLVTLLPVIGLVQSGDQVMADRFTYIPLVGLFIIIAWAGAEAVAYQPRLLSIVVAVALAILTASAVAARQQVQYWRNSETLWQRALNVTTANHRAHAALGEVLDKQGQTEAAIGQYRAALRIVPDQAEWRNTLGVLYTRQNKVFEAMGQFAVATKVRPGFADAHNNLGAMHARAGQPEQAITAFTDAIRLAPGNALAHGNLALVLARQDRLDEALREAREAARLDPSSADWKQLAEALSRRVGK